MIIGFMNENRIEKEGNPTSNNFNKADMAVHSNVINGKNF